MSNIIITGARKGIGRYLAEYYINLGHNVFGCSRKPSDLDHPKYTHFCLDVTDEVLVSNMFNLIGKIDVVINNAGIASMNHSIVTPLKTVQHILETNVIGTYSFCRQAAKSMSRSINSGRIINFSTVAVPLKLEGEAIYAASKAAIELLTQILAKEYAPFNITVNAVAPTPIRTDLIKSIPKDKMDKLKNKLTIKRLGEFEDISNVIDFFIKPESNYITGQIIYLGGA